MHIKASTVFNYIFIICCCALSLLPYILMGLSAFNTSVDIKKGDIFSHPSFVSFAANYKALMDNAAFFSAIENTLFVSIGAMFLGVLLSSMAAYAYTILKNKVTNKIFYLSFFAILIPSATTIIPLFMLLQKVNMLNSLFTVILVSLSIPFTTFILVQNAKSFPIDLIKAARADGMSEVGIYFKVFIPTLKPVFITAAIISFIDMWNGFMMPLIIVQSLDLMTLPLFLNNLGANQSADYGIFMLALVVSTIPILLIFLFSQKFFTMGMKGI